MKTRLEQVLDHCLKGREIALWGTPSRSLLRELEKYPFREEPEPDRSRQYVIAATDGDLKDFLSDSRSAGFRDVEDYLSFPDVGKELPFDWELKGVPIGRQTYFGEGFAEACENGWIERIGRYTSINGTASASVDHQRNAVFLSDELPRCFTGENKALFRQRCEADPGHPYGTGKSRLTIGNDVWIGANAFLNCSKVTKIGDGAIIGTGAVVLEDVPPYAIAVGVPARIKGYRFDPKMIETLLRVKWWNWEEAELNRHADALLDPQLFYERFGRE